MSKFNHLEGSRPKAKSIKNMPVHLLDEERLPETRVHFENIISENPDRKKVIKAAQEIITKIDNILDMQNISFVAANNIDYSPSEAKAS